MAYKARDLDMLTLQLPMVCTKTPSAPCSVSLWYWARGLAMSFGTWLGGRKLKQRPEVLSISSLLPLFPQANTKPWLVHLKPPKSHHILDHPWDNGPLGYHTCSDVVQAHPLLTKGAFSIHTFFWLQKNMVTTETWKLWKIQRKSKLSTTPPPRDNC